jgi:hypothetical protein
MKEKRSPHEKEIMKIMKYEKKNKPLQSIYGEASYIGHRMATCDPTTRGGALGDTNNW